jgi:hypothetical protein
VIISCRRHHILSRLASSTADSCPTTSAVVMDIASDVDVSCIVNVFGNLYCWGLQNKSTHSSCAHVLMCVQHPTAVWAVPVQLSKHHGRLPFLCKVCSAKCVRWGEICCLCIWHLRGQSQWRSFADLSRPTTSALCLFNSLYLQWIGSPCVVCARLACLGRSGTAIGGSLCCYQICGVSLRLCACQVHYGSGASRRINARICSSFV